MEYDIEDEIKLNGLNQLPQRSSSLNYSPDNQETQRYHN